MDMTVRLRIGTRGSPLALAQAREVRGRLSRAEPGLTEESIEIVVIRTTGDRIQSRPLAEIGGKGLFTKEIENAMLAGTVDIAVHSMKDVPTQLPDGLIIAGLPVREDPRDALISGKATSLADLPAAATVGTSSLRRQALLLHRRPDLRVVPFRGNVETRLRKLAEGEVDATLLAIAGLRRLGRADAAAAVLAPEELLPAVCQGAIGIECRAGDRANRDRLAAITDGSTASCVTAERALLAGLDGSCRTPIAALAVLEHDRIWLRAQIARPDGASSIATERRGAASDAEALGDDAARELRRRGGPDFFADP
jgi:hydroxymethylbilane synthase